MSTEPKSGARITVRAQTPIAAGQEVTVHYISFMYGHFRSVRQHLFHQKILHEYIWQPCFRRKRDIEAFWFFKCQCQRCLDPTGLVPNMVTLIRIWLCRPFL